MSEKHAEEKPDLFEHGRDELGKPVHTERRLYLQLLAFGECKQPQTLVETLTEGQLQGALYLDLNDPQGIALVIAHEDPDYFVDPLRALLNRKQFLNLRPKPEYTMFGRTYTLGYETDLEHVLLRRPVERICNPDWPWAIWYPLRRSGSFEQLSPQEQRSILMEHGRIGNAYGEAGLAHDVRLACHGFDKQDNDFIIGLIGKDLYPLSAIVQRMRKTQQTSRYLEKLGPFFAGKVIWQSSI